MTHPPLNSLADFAKLAEQLSEADDSQQKARDDLDHFMERDVVLSNLLKEAVVLGMEHTLPDLEIINDWREAISLPPLESLGE